MKGRTPLTECFTSPRNLCLDIVFQSRKFVAEIRILLLYVVNFVVGSVSIQCVEDAGERSFLFVRRDKIFAVYRIGIAVWSYRSCYDGWAYFIPVWIYAWLIWNEYMRPSDVWKMWVALPEVAIGPKVDCRPVFYGIFQNHRLARAHPIPVEVQWWWYLVQNWDFIANHEIWNIMDIINSKWSH